MAEPKCRKSNTDIEEDIRAMPKTENREPKRAKLLTDIVDPR